YPSPSELATRSRSHHDPSTAADERLYAPSPQRDRKDHRSPVPALDPTHTGRKARSAATTHSADKLLHATLQLGPAKERVSARRSQEAAHSFREYAPTDRVECPWKRRSPRA